ncbi:hypothetical protein COV49_00705 [Candidatus Falkowbacteria bacterium CG11_big_fil_rev_8_21_14_0_20_39_10]|uniref:histidine kinase n=1 Tax=Candidatus Falkowbacteria bacterium CG11_big_fil_rev_8_21_14_0_20_39_10 TaxID=1974570 RepID=A0A2M6KA58_9BACT|nr:MAG: hypothetical protein COV49_00705 [Candidatus Falkowbacteria bacterium CG11_big_fil_rev_8_21_14_0_20_39_10]
MSIKEFFTKNREAAQLAYGLVLIIVIPALIVFNTIFIINKYNSSIDVALQRQALGFGRAVSALISDDLDKPEELQSQVIELQKSSPDIMDLSVLAPEGENFRVTASTEEEDIGKAFDFYFYKLAWSQARGDGLATDSLLLSRDKEGNDLLANYNPNDRFWLVAMPMSDLSGNKQALLATRLSAQVVNDLTKYNRNASIYLLMVTVLIVILFLAASVRLWDYVLLYRKIKEVDQMKDEFISIASHELRTPVTSIRGYVSMAIDGSLGPISKKAKESLEMVQKSADRLAGLVEDLLNVSRIEQGRLQVDLKPVEVGAVIREIEEELRVQADEKKLKLLFHPHAEKLPLVNLDSERFKQVLINLIGNAIKYTEKGQVEIITQLAETGKILEIRIKDTGIGMTAEERGRLFEKFYRVQNEKTRKIIGTGLGLWITKQILEMMEGKITVDSIKDVGTQVTLSFPIIK